MQNLSKIQVAMCKVIKECGFDGLDKVKVNELSIQPLHRANDVTCMRHGNPSVYADWIIKLDGNELTNEEYEAWSNQK